MKVTFLGTGTSQGIPVIASDHPVCKSEDPRDKRLRVSVMVSWDRYNYVIDCGPDFRQQMLANQVRHIDGILFTHEHADHIMGLDDIRPFFFKQGDIPIYAHKRVLKSLQRKFDYIFAAEDRYPGAPAVQAHEVVNGRSLHLGGIDVIPVNAMHNRLQVFGYRFGDFAYLTDVKHVEDTEAAKLSGVKVLVVNALRKEAHHSHFNLEEAMEFVKKINPERAYFTHISAYLGFHAKVQKELPEGMYLAYDNLEIEI